MLEAVQQEQPAKTRQLKYQPFESNVEPKAPNVGVSPGEDKGVQSPISIPKLHTYPSQRSSERDLA